MRGATDPAAAAPRGLRSLIDALPDEGNAHPLSGDGRCRGGTPRPFPAGPRLVTMVAGGLGGVS